MAITTASYFQRYMPRRFNEIANWTKTSIELPRDVVMHYLLNDGTYGPRRNGTLISNLLEEHDDVYVANVFDIDKDDLHGRRIDVSKKRKAESEYFSKNRHFSRVHNLERVLDRANAPLIVNYNHIFHIYRAMDQRILNVMYRNFGDFNTMWNYVAELETEAMQLIPIRLPRIIPEREAMRKLLEREDKNNMLKMLKMGDIYLYSLMRMFYDEEMYPQYANRNVVFRLVDGINFVDIPFKLLLTEKERKGSTQRTRLDEFYEIINTLQELRSDAVEDGDTEVELKASVIKIDNTPSDVLDIEKNLERSISQAVQMGTLSEREVARVKKDATKFAEVELDGVKVKDIMEKSKKDKRLLPMSTIPKVNAPVGESILSNTVQEMDRKYISENMEQDLIENLATLSNSGHIVLDVRKKEKRDAASDEVEYSVQTRHAVSGAVGTLKFTIPKVKEDGTFRMGGVNYRMGRQRMSLPIVKIAPNEVAMTSSHSKMFATTGRTAADNLNVKLSREINAQILDGKITDAIAGKPLKPGNRMGLIEGTLFAEFGKLTKGQLKLDFEKGHSYKGDPVKFNDVGELVGRENYGPALQLLEIDPTRIGKIFSEVRIKGAHIPIGVILGSWLGMDEFFKRIGVVSKEFDINQRVDRSEGMILRFKDVKLLIKYRNVEQMLLLNGLLKNEDYFREINRDDLDKTSGWKVFFTLMGLGRSQERGIANIRNAWIDAITAKLLYRQEYPTNMVDLFLSVNRLLSDSKFHREADGDLMFIRGYDRINDIIYRELAVAMNDFEANNSSKRKLTMNPKAVKMAILSDGLVSPTEDTSPINQISNQTRIGYGGTGGRSDRSMVARHRVFDKNDLGVISEAGTDDGKAGTVLNTPVNPNFDSIYGTSAKDKKIEVGNVLSINSAVAPFILHDEMKRVIFSRIHSNSMIYSEGYRIMPVFTGAGLIVAHQVDGNYTHVAKDDGTIIKVEEGKYLEVKYKDGTKKKLKMGRGFSRNSGKILPKQLITDYKVKDTFRKGAVLVWDKNYFDRSFLDPDQVELYTGTPIFVAIKDEMDTYEDGSAIDKQDGDEAMATNVIHTRTISVKYNQNFKLLIKEGDYVAPNTPVAIIAPEGVEITEDAATLDFMSQVTPKAQHSGNVVRIEVNYIGDPKEASPGLRKAIRESDAQFKEESEYTDCHTSGEVLEPTYINQEYLDKESAVITLYIEHLDKYSVGDKSSDCNALKTVNGYAWSGRMETLQGIRVSSKFSGDGIFRRVVTSSFSMGILNFAQYTAGRRMSDIYHGRIKK